MLVLKVVVLKIHFDKPTDAISCLKINVQATKANRQSAINKRPAVNPGHISRFRNLRMCRKWPKGYDHSAGATNRNDNMVDI